MNKLRIANLTEPKTVHPFKAKKREDKCIGKMSDGQTRKVWQLMYSLEKLDKKPSSAKLGDRLCGIIKKNCILMLYRNTPLRGLHISRELN